MVNRENKLTVDDLIVEYMIYKVKNGYEPSFFTSEFITFLYYFEDKMKVEDVLYDNNELFQRFFERKAKIDWSTLKNWDTEERIVVPHMDMEYRRENIDYLISANYRLSDYDKSIINTYLMDNGMGKFDDFKGKTREIRKIIGEFLKDEPKRKIDESIELDDNDLMIGKYVTAQIVQNIWYSYIDKEIELHHWPRQCRDINKYLFDIDLAEIIGVKSIKNELIDLYNTFSRRIAIMYHQDRNLRISSKYSSYLARANYELLIEGYEEIVDRVFGPFKKELEIDLSTLTYKESYEIEGDFYIDEDPIIEKSTTTKVENDEVKRLVKSLEKSTQKN